VSLDRVVDEDAGGEIGEDGAQCLEPVLLDEILDNEHGLVVGEHEVLAALGLEKGAGHLADGREVAVLEDHATVVGCHLLPPVGMPLLFLVDRDALAEPARHLVFCRGQGDDVTVLVPERGLPVTLTGGGTAGAIHRDDGAEADPEEPLTAEGAEGSDRKILLIGIKLDEGRFLDDESILGPEDLLRLGEQFDDAVAVDLGLFGG